MVKLGLAGVAVKRGVKIALDWVFEPQAVPDTATAVVRALCSFGTGHQARIGHLAAVLMPASVSDDTHWANWLLLALQANLPERLRLVVIDLLDQPRLGTLTSQRDARISVRRPGPGLCTPATLAGPAGGGCCTS